MIQIKIKTKTKKYYKGATLAEMMIVMVIFGIIFFMISLVLTTVLRVSDVSAGKIMSRQESSYILEMINRTLRNSNPDYIFVYNVPQRSVDLSTLRIYGSTLNNYSDLKVKSGNIGNQVHVKPFYSSRWICIGIFNLSTDSNQAVILKTSTDLDLDKVGHDKCFDSSRSDFKEYTVILNSGLVNIKSFKIRPLEEEDNVYFAVKTVVQPIYWSSGNSLLKPDYTKMTIVSTRKLTYGD